MEINSLIVLCAYPIGVILLFIGLSGFIQAKTKMGFCMVFTGALIIGGTLFFSHSIGTEKKEALIQEIADLLETTPNNIILEDITEPTTFFRSGRNESLRKVYFDSKVYIAEIDGYKVNKLIEVRGDDN